MSEEEFDELLDLMSEQNLTQHGADKLYGEIVSREIERRTLKEQLQQKENIIKEVREFIYKCNDGKQGINYSGCSKLLEILDRS